MASSRVLHSVREEDYVEYFIFPLINTNEHEENILYNHLAHINVLVKELSKEYIWHKDGFNLTVNTKSNYLLSEDSNSKETLPAHLYGITHFGDNIEDEWFIVYLLCQLSKETDVVIRVLDNDGEFLLIEAAEQLPSWADPDTCEKRVYIYKGNIHLIPADKLQNTEIEVTEALEIIRNNSQTEASTQIQEAIFKRISVYPKKIRESLHRCKVYLPVGVATILNHKPNLIAPAIISFCNRDPIDMKACRTMKYFPPENRVFASVTFTKCLYAMVLNSKYTPDKRIGWNLPTCNSAEYKSHILGIKIACGFEILASQAKPSMDLETDKGWHQYLKQLKERDYFRGLLEHSQEYNNLMNNARDYFKSHRDSMHYNPTLGQEIIDLHKKLEHNIEELKKAEENLPPDDDETWLDINPDVLDKMLQERYGCRSNGNTDSRNVAGKLTEFLDHVSGIEGVEFPQDSKSKPNVDDSPIRPQRGIKKNKPKVSFGENVKSENAESPRINFDAANFSCAVQNILDLYIPDDNWDLESGSEMSEYEDETEMNVDKMNPQKVNKKMKQYMDAMDMELAGTTIGKSFEKKEDAFDDIESFQPVDIDMSALKNMLESYQSQMGGSGPATNMLGPMGVHLEQSTSKQSDFRQ